MRSPAALPPRLLHRGAIKLVWSLLRNLHLPTRSPTVPLSPSLQLKKKEENIETDLKNKRELLSLRGVVSLSLPFHGRVELARVGGHARAPANSLSHGYMTTVELATCRVPEDPASPALAGRHHGVRGVLRVRIWCAFASISLLAAIVLWLGAAPLYSFRDPTYSGLRDPMRGLYGD
jgi:hypothetical protein